MSYVTLSGVSLNGLTIGPAPAPPPPPPAENYYWTATDGYTTNATLYDNGHYLIYSPFPGDVGNSIYVRSKAIIVGQRYCEFEVTAAATNAYAAFGVTQQIVDVFYNPGSGNIMTGNNGCGLAQQGTYNNGTATSSNSKYNFGAGDRIGIAFDATTKNMWISKNGTWLDGDPNTLSSPSMTVAVAGDMYFFHSQYTCTVPGTKTVYIYPDAAQQTYAAPTGFVPYAS